MRIGYFAVILVHYHIFLLFDNMILNCLITCNISRVNRRAIYGSGFVPNPEPTNAKSGGKKMHLSPTVGVIESSGSDHQRAVGGSVGVKILA